MRNTNIDAVLDGLNKKKLNESVDWDMDIDNGLLSLRGRQSKLEDDIADFIGRKYSKVFSIYGGEFGAVIEMDTDDSGLEDIGEVITEIYITLDFGKEIEDTKGVLNTIKRSMRCLKNQKFSVDTVREDGKEVTKFTTSEDDAERINVILDNFVGDGCRIIGDMYEYYPKNEVEDMIESQENEWEDDIRSRNSEYFHSR